YRVSGNSEMYPEQIRAGLHAWKPKKLYFAGGFGGPGGGRGRGAPAAPQPASTERRTGVNTAEYDELLGRTYAEIGSDARSNHKCQGTGGMPPLPGFGGGREIG